MSDEIVVRPNDRLIRGVLLCIAIAWWFMQVGEVIQGPAGLMSLLPFVPMLWLLAWVAVGRWAFRTSEGSLVVDRRLMKFTFWRTAYPIASISGFRVEEQMKKIKGNTSPRYRVLMGVEADTREVAWSRQRTDAEALASQLGALAGRRY